MGKINVKGNAAMEFTADIMELSLTVNVESASAVTAAEKGKSQTEALLKTLAELGLDLKEIAMKSESVSEQRSYNGNPPVFRFTKDLELKAAASLPMLEAISAAIIKNNIPAHYSENFALSNLSECENKVIQAALADAKAKAELIASATGGKIIGLDSAEYEYCGESACCEAVYAKELTRGAEPLAAKLSPDKITVKKEIKTVWLAM